MLSLAPPCIASFEHRNKVLIGTSLFAAYHQRLLSTKSQRKCSMATENVARNPGIISRSVNLGSLCASSRTEAVMPGLRIGIVLI